MYWHVVFSQVTGFSHTTTYSHDSCLSSLSSHSLILSFPAPAPAPALFPVGSPLPPEQTPYTPNPEQNAPSSEPRKSVPLSSQRYRNQSATNLFTLFYTERYNVSLMSSAPCPHPHSIRNDCPTLFQYSKARPCLTTIHLPQRHVTVLQ